MSNAEADPNLFQRIAAHGPKIIAASTMATIAVCTMGSGAAQAHESHEAFAVPEGAVTFVTYNIEGSNHPDAGQRGSTKRRTDQMVKEVNGVTGAPAADFLGSQETQPDQFDEASKQLAKVGIKSVFSRYTDDPEFYNALKFTALDKGIVKFPTYGDKYNAKARKGPMTGDAVWIRAEDNATHVVYDVINAHFVAWNTDKGSDDEGGWKRFISALILQKWAADMHREHPNDIINELVDANNTCFRRDEVDHRIYVDIAKDNYVTKKQFAARVLQTDGMISSYEDYKGLPGGCVGVQPTFQNKTTVDYVIHSRNAKTIYYEKRFDGITDGISDHEPVYSVEMPTSLASTSTTTATTGAAPAPSSKSTTPAMVTQANKRQTNTFGAPNHHATIRRQPAPHGKSPKHANTSR